MEADTGKAVADYFDLITGTSTGGIVAIGLGLWLPAMDHLSRAGQFSFDDARLEKQNTDLNRPRGSTQ